MKRWEIDKFIDAESQKKIYESFAAGRDGRAPTEHDLERLISWCGDIVSGRKRDDGDVGKSMVAAMLAGQIEVCRFNDKGEPMFRMNEIGRAHVTKNILVKPEMREMIRRLDEIHGTKTELPPVDYEIDDN